MGDGRGVWAIAVGPGDDTSAGVAASMAGTGGGEVGDPSACSGAGAGVKSGSPPHAVRTITSIEPTDKRVSHAVKRANTIKRHFRAYRIRR